MGFWADPWDPQAFAADTGTEGADDPIWQVRREITGFKQVATSWSGDWEVLGLQWCNDALSCSWGSWTRGQPKWPEHHHSPLLQNGRAQGAQPVTPWQGMDNIQLKDMNARARIFVAPMPSGGRISLKQDKQVVWCYLEYFCRNHGNRLAQI